MSCTHRHRADGFTLVELLITIAVIAVLASIAVPNLLQSRTAADEAAAVATLRAVATAQAQFQSRRLVDSDRDGTGEFGRLAEMAGSAPLRGELEHLGPALLPASLGGIDAGGRAVKSGYHVALYLPGSGGIGLAETAANLASYDANLAETHWTCIAWPAQHGATGRFTYFVNETGTIVKSDATPYSGTTHVPPAGAALLGAASAAHITGGRLAAQTVGADGGFWHAVH